MSSVSTTRHNLNTMKGLSPSTIAVIGKFVFKGQSLAGGILQLKKFSEEVWNLIGKVDLCAREKFEERRDELATRVIPETVIKQSRLVIELLDKARVELSVEVCTMEALGVPELENVPRSWCRSIGHAIVEISSVLDSLNQLDSKGL